MMTESTITRLLRAAVKVGDDYYTIEETIALPPSASDDQIAQAVATGLRIYEAQRVAVEQQIGELRGRAAAGPAQMRDPDAPASEKQRKYMEYLLKELVWTNEQLVAFAAERSLNLLTLTKHEASGLIDELKQVLAGGAVEPPRDYAAEGAAMYAAYAGQGATPEQRMQQRDAERDFGYTPTPKEMDLACLDGSAYGPDDDDDEADPLGFGQPPLPSGERATQRQIRALERLVDERGIDLLAELKARFGGRGLVALSMDEAGQLLGEFQRRPRVVRRG